MLAIIRKATGMTIIRFPRRNSQFSKFRAYPVFSRTITKPAMVTAQNNRSTGPKSAPPPTREYTRNTESRIERGPSVTRNAKEKNLAASRILSTIRSRLFLSGGGAHMSGSTGLQRRGLLCSSSSPSGIPYSQFEVGALKLILGVLEIQQLNSCSCWSQRV